MKGSWIEWIKGLFWTAQSDPARDALNHAKHAPLRAKRADSHLELLSLIQKTLKPDGEGKITYSSEWLGHLPFGLYHWIEVDGTDISSQIQIPEMDAALENLKTLMASGKLTLIKGDFDKHKKTLEDGFHLEFKLTNPSSPAP